MCIALKDSKCGNFLIKGKYNFVKQLLLSLHNSREPIIEDIYNTESNEGLIRRDKRNETERMFVVRRTEWSAVSFGEGQANKSARGMPWHQEPMKDVTSCDKLRGAANER